MALNFTLKMTLLLPPKRFEIESDPLPQITRGAQSSNPNTTFGISGSFGRQTQLGEVFQTEDIDVYSPLDTQQGFVQSDHEKAQIYAQLSQALAQLDLNQLDFLDRLGTS